MDFQAELLGLAPEEATMDQTQSKKKRPTAAASKASNGPVAKRPKAEASAPVDTDGGDDFLLSLLGETEQPASPVRQKKLEEPAPSAVRPFKSMHGMRAIPGKSSAPSPRPCRPVIKKASAEEETGENDNFLSDLLGLADDDGPEETNVSAPTPAPTRKPAVLKRPCASKAGAVPSGARPVVRQLTPVNDDEFMIDDDNLADVAPSAPSTASRLPVKKPAKAITPHQANDAIKALITDQNIYQYYDKVLRKRKPKVTEECKALSATVHLYKVSWTLNGETYLGAASAAGKEKSKKDAYRRLIVQLPVDDQEESTGAEDALKSLKFKLKPTYVSPCGCIWDVPARGTDTERFEGKTKMEMYSKLGPQVDRLLKLQQATVVKKSLPEEMRDLLLNDNSVTTVYSRAREQLNPKISNTAKGVAWTFTDFGGKQVTVNGVGATPKAYSKSILNRLGILPETGPSQPKYTNIHDVVNVDHVYPAWWWQLPFFTWFTTIITSEDAAEVDDFMEHLVALSERMPLPVDLWEVFIEEAAYSIRPHEGTRMPQKGAKEEEWRGVRLLDYLCQMEVDPAPFSSDESRQYYLHHRSMVAYEQWAKVQHVAIEACGGRDWNCSLATVKYASQNLITVAGCADDLDEKDIVVLASKKCGNWANTQQPETMPLICRVEKSGRELTLKPLDKFTGKKGDYIKMFVADTYEITFRRSQALRALACSLPIGIHRHPPIKFTPVIKRLLINAEFDNSGQKPSTGDSQQDAIAAACDDSIPITLIQGPPGTGKTYVCCGILEAWHKSPHQGKILAVADTNVAADNIQEGLRRRGVASLRIGVGGDDELAKEQFRNCSKFVSYVAALKKRDRAQLVSLRQMMTAELMKTVDVVIATCIGIGNDAYKSITFSKVIVDECTQAVEASSVVALGRNATKIVLVGDHEQLPPTVFSSRAKELGLDISLYERIRSQLTPFTLTTQRRMHPQISHFARQHTYGGKIIDGVTAADRPPVEGLHWPNRVLLVDTTFREQSRGVSKINQPEAQALMATLRTVIARGGIQPNEIGVLTPYNAQKRCLINATQDDPELLDVKVDTIDGFQGKERELIVFSAVRCNDRGTVGFLADNRRSNVMFTRARRGLIVFGSKQTLYHDPVWKKWIDHLIPRNGIIPYKKWIEMNQISG